MTEAGTGNKEVRTSEQSVETRAPAAAEIAQPEVPSYVETYLEKVISDTGARATLAQWLFYLVRVLMICGASVTAIFVNLTGQTDRLVAASTSVVVLLLIALDWGSNALTRYQTYRSVSNRLTTEKYLFLSKAGGYAGLPAKRAQAVLAQRIEAVLSEADGGRADKNPGPGDQSAVEHGPVVANYDGEIVATLEWSPDASSVIGRLRCHFRSAVGLEAAEDRLLPGGEGTRPAIVRIQGEDVDPVEFVVKAMVVSGGRVTAFPRVVTVYAPVNGRSETFEFALVAEGPEPDGTATEPAGKGAVLVDISQAGRTIQFLELEMMRERRTSSPRLLS
jgi:uncharacterized protein DUF4231